MRQILTQRDFGQGNKVHIGRIPNTLALAHFLATAPLFAEKRLFVLMEHEKDRHTMAQAFLQPIVLEWIGRQIDLPRIQQSPQYIIADQRTLEEALHPSVHAFKDARKSVSTGERVQLEELKTWLTHAGYEREATANTFGRWASRGDVLDIHTHLPFRITFDGTRVESIVSFDLETGATLVPIASLILPPLNLHGRTSLIDHLPQDTLIVLFHQPALTDTPCAQVIIEPFSVSPKRDAAYRAAKSYHRRYEEAQQDAKGKTLYLFTAHAEKMRELFAQRFKDASAALTHIHSLTQSDDGFVNEEAGVIALTDRSLGMEEERKRTQTRKLSQAMIQSLQKGDHVVHLFHGIAKFMGTTVMHVNGFDREYFVLEYAERDKIYVPVELTERIDKYIGSPNPQLHTLSNASWHEVVKRITQETLELARELLDLYAKRSASTAMRMEEHSEERALHDACPFTLTHDQQEAIGDVFHDMQQEKPMDRLLCGDVGFGKTEVALRAAFRAVLNGYQVAVLAPTTVLTQQHFDTFCTRLEKYGVGVRALSRFEDAATQRGALRALAEGSTDIVVGTHRLLSRDVQFKHLGLIIVDEEQRFGVKSKERLTQMRKNAHVLTMTATPIPRTLHLSLSGVREISTILTPPNERKPVQLTIQQLDNTRIQEAITHELERGGQTYYIYNRVQSIQLRKQQLQVLVPHARIAVGHGQLDAKELSIIMHRFDVGEIDVLLATTIVENGLDIPNANTLIVENASQFGLGELYQLKGRVGRSTLQGYAYFFYTEQEIDVDAKKRFIALQESEHLGAGFELAMKDMEIRGVGNMLGKEQHGHAMKIGLNLYVRLLNTAVQSLEGVETETERDIPIDLPLEARIPEEYLPHDADRILLYQQLASIRDLEELLRRRDALAQQHRDAGREVLHPALTGLFDLLEIKLHAAHSSLLSINTAYPTPENKLASPRITLTADRAFPTELPTVWEPVWTKTTVYKVRATIAELGAQWPEALKATLRMLQVDEALRKE